MTARLRNSIFVALAFTALSALTVSCKKDEAKSSQDKIVGVWNLEKTQVTYTSDGRSQSETDPFEAGSTAEFKADGNAIVKVDTSTYTGTWKVEGQKLISSNIADMTGLAEGLDIKTLTDNELVLYGKQTDTLYSMPVLIEVNVFLNK